MAFKKKNEGFSMIKNNKNFKFDKKKMIIVGAICGVFAVSGTMFMLFSDGDAKTNSPVLQEITSDTLEENNTVSESDIEKNLEERRNQGATLSEEEVSKNNKKDSEKNETSDKEGALNQKPSSSTSNKPSKNNTQSSTDSSTSKPSTSKPSTSSGGNGSTSKPENKPSKDETVPGFSKDEIINGGDNVESRPPAVSDDDTPVGEM